MKEEGGVPGPLLAYCAYRFEGLPSTPLLLLAESLRRSGGASASWPIRCYLREDEQPGPELRSEAAELGVELRHYRGEEGLSDWPFADKALAAARAEEEAEGELLVWMDRDSLVFGDLGPLLLPGDRDLAYRPVNLRNIGSLRAEAPDEFWARALELAGFGAGGRGEKELGTTRSYLGEEELRFYLAAGLLCLRPRLGVFGAWAGLLRRFAADPLLGRLAAAGPRRIFLHQAALSLAVASLVAPERRLELPIDLMYPLNLWERDDEARRPRPVDALRSLRYDEVLEVPSWRRLPFSPLARAWLETRLGGPGAG